MGYLKDKHRASVIWRRDQARKRNAQIAERKRLGAAGLQERYRERSLARERDAAIAKQPPAQKPPARQPPARQPPALQPPALQPQPKTPVVGATGSPGDGGPIIGGFPGETPYGGSVPTSVEELDAVRDDGEARPPMGTPPPGGLQEAYLNGKLDVARGIERPSLTTGRVAALDQDIDEARRLQKEIRTARVTGTPISDVRRQNIAAELELEKARSARDVADVEGMHSVEQTRLQTQQLTLAQKEETERHLAALAEQSGDRWQKAVNLEREIAFKDRLREGNHEVKIMQAQTDLKRALTGERKALSDLTASDKKQMEVVLAMLKLITSDTIGSGLNQEKEAYDKLYDAMAKLGIDERPASYQIVRDAWANAFLKNYGRLPTENEMRIFDSQFGIGDTSDYE